jgi:type I restriction enzyme R subunit
LDGEDKDFGYIVDYKDLFKNLVNDKGTGALQVYSSELDHSAGGAEPEVLMQNRLKKGKERLDEALEALDLLCEKVLPPRTNLEFIQYFCGNTEIPTDLKEREPQREALYKGTVGLIRSYANIADELEQAGYDEKDITRIKGKLDEYLKLRETIRNASNESLDLKAYEADMRHLIDTYIQADEPRIISPFEDQGLLQLIVKSGIAEAIALRLDGIKGNEEAVAETIENNVRSKIIKEELTDPAFYEKMSALLGEIITARKSKAVKYEEYLQKIAELVRKVAAGMEDDTPEVLKRSPALRALFNSLKKAESPLELAKTIDETVKRVRPDAWKGVKTKESIIKHALNDILKNKQEVERIFQIIKEQSEY